MPSGTSFLVSFARGLGVDDRSRDLLASKWLPRWMGVLVEAPGYLGFAAPLYRRALRATSFGMIDHMILRTAVIDAKLSEAIELGVEQVVILGAGLDARAWRMSALVGKTIFEVDHPSTQRFKCSQIADREPPTDVRYVPVDFEHESFSTALATAGFRDTTQTAWIWEGVAMYLPKAAVLESLAQMTRLSAPKSALLMTYRVPGELPFGQFGKIAIPLLFSAGGEALQMTLSPSELKSTLAPHWRVEYDEDADDWRRFTESNADPARSFRSERFAFAIREE